jgi:hypothetical protein
MDGRFLISAIREGRNEKAARLRGFFILAVA